MPTTPPAALLPLQSAPAPAALPAAAPMPGNGWIGLTVDDSVVTGRLVVVDVAANGPAASSGIRLQDQLLAINGLPLRSADQLAAALAAITPGTAVKVAIGRSDRIEEIELKAVPRPSARPAAGPLPEEWQPAAAVPGPIQQPAPMPAAIAAPPLQAPRSAVHTAVPAAVPSAKGRTALGVRTLPVDPAVQARFRLAEPAGALVVGVVQDLPASKAGIPPGSVIVALGERPVRSPSDLTSVVTSSPAGRPITLQYILPGGETRRAEVSLQSLELPLERAAHRPGPLSARCSPDQTSGRGPLVIDRLRDEFAGLSLTRLEPESVQLLLQRDGSRRRGSPHPAGRSGRLPPKPPFALPSGT